MRSVAGSRQGLPPSQSASALIPGRNFCETKSTIWRKRSSLAPNAGCTSKPSRPPGQGVSGPGQRRVAVGHEHDAREIAADQRLERGAHFREVAGQIAIEHRLRIFDRSKRAATPQQGAFGRRFDDDVGDQAGEVDVVRTDRQQHEIELAVGLFAARHRHDGR